ncbi:alpha-D-ribose 1-methylphosphonate 5-triphosphate diphosphatase [Aliiroseovarius sp.]|uniref:alpha-D-ribose 1-methylphosphonate 5-triphosphate diphosphatase n=1 Tax=Aliiroseovarius sp. TaxID=1872442 RepID=UPI003BAB2994
MPQKLPPLRLTGATILREGRMQDRSVVIEDGRITKGPRPAVDLSGFWILPGIIDLHGDAFERHIAPRPSAPFPIASGLASVDRDAAANGVTTAWLAQSWSWEGGKRSPDYAEELLQDLDIYRKRALTDLRVQLRVETHMVDSGDRLLAAVRRHGIDYVVFNNHLDEAVNAWDVKPNVIATWAAQHRVSPEELMAKVTHAKERGGEVPRFLCRLAEAFDGLGVTYGSHDDETAETREWFSTIGAKICEFPTARAPAAVARAIGDPVLMGAPNVVRGGSQSGNIAAVDLIRDGLCHALVSDYHYPSLAQAAFRLVDDGVLDLPRAWAMISTKPAEIKRLPDRGRIEYGRRADLVVVNKDTRAIEATIAGGKLTHLCGLAARRFMDAINGGMQLAAE